ncbi:MAG: hypothetical protein WBN07_15120 [Woeseiaceae bacterium]
MSGTRTFHIFLLALLAGMLLAACAAREVLQPKSAVVPAGLDLSGQWQLRSASGQPPQRRESGEPGIRIPPETSTRSQQRQSPRRSRASDATAVSVFMENGESLKITQTASGLFISFDRAIVEEYRFGEDRVIAVGPIEAQRVSGWQGDRFVIETLDEAGALLAESWQLSSDGEALLRNISLTRRDETVFSAEQRFDRR